MEASSASNDTGLATMDNVTSLDTNDTTLTPPQSATGASIASPIVMFLAGLIGNVLALMVLHKTKTEIRSMMFYTLVAALTWNDLLGICLTSPPVLAAYLNERHMPALPTLCRFHALAMVCFGLSTPFIVCTMAIERSLALKCSYFYSKYCTPHSARLTVAALWVFVLFFGALPLFDLGSYSLQYPRTWCFLDFRPSTALDKAYAYAYAIINLVVVAVMIFCNALVMTTLCQVRRTRRMSNASVNSTLLNADAVDEKARPPQQVRRRHHRDVELQMIWLLCAITTIFSVCWVPLMAYILFCLQSPNSSSPVFGLVAVRLASLNQTLNPWIYVILRKSLLSRLRKLCKECFLCDDDLDQPQPLRKPLTQYPRIQQMRAAQVKSRPNNYVHVRHQLCPSSQFVGQQNGSASLAEGQKRSKGSGSSSRSRSQGSASVCSICKARMRVEGAGQDNSSSANPSVSQGNKNQDCSLMGSPVCSATCDGSTENADATLSLFAEENQARYFSHLPHHTLPYSQDTSQDHVSEASVLSRRQSGRGRVTSAANIPSYISEADDHGYSSRVSTDSSRMSTPERSQSIGAHPEDQAQRPRPTSTLSESAKPPGGEEGPGGHEVGSHALKNDGFDIHFSCEDDNGALTSGVFDSSQDATCEECKATGDVNQMDRVVAGQTVVDKPAASRTVSCSSAGARSESSSSQDRPTVIHRHLSSSSGH